MLAALKFQSVNVEKLAWDIASTSLFYVLSVWRGCIKPTHCWLTIAKYIFPTKQLFTLKEIGLLIKHDYIIGKYKMDTHLQILNIYKDKLFYFSQLNILLKAKLYF